jgi:hypothetical protein
MSWRPGGVPARLYTLVVLAPAGLLALGAAITVGVNNAHAGLGEVADRSAPRAETAAHLYFALADLDAQVANVLLVGSDEQIGNRQLALRQMRVRRAEITADLQTLSAAGAPAETVKILIDGLGRYDSYVAQARLADEQVQDRPPGRPPVLARNYFASATSILHDDLLPAADRLGRSASEEVAANADSDRVDARWAALVVASVGLLLVAILIAGQVWWARRFRRILAPGLVAVTLATAALTASGVALLTDHASRLRSAQTQAFGPFLELARARATASDANADESRFVILPDRAELYGDGYAAKSALLAQAVPNERVAARLAAFRRDDEKLRAAVASGRLDVAVGLTTKVGRGNLAFDFYDYQTALMQVAEAERVDFHRRADSADDALAGWSWITLGVLAVCVVLVLATARPRLREYA